MVKNILFILHTPGGSEKENSYALVPDQELKDIDLDAINGIIVNCTQCTSEAGDKIVELYQRFGLEDMEIASDLAKYMNPTAPFLVDRVIKIGWAT